MHPPITCELMACPRSYALVLIEGQRISLKFAPAVAVLLVFTSIRLMLLG
jgi:hypothetical protein